MVSAFRSIQRFACESSFSFDPVTSEKWSNVIVFVCLKSAIKIIQGSETIWGDCIISRNKLKGTEIIGTYDWDEFFSTWHRDTSHDRVIPHIALWSFLRKWKRDSGKVGEVGGGPTIAGRVSGIQWLGSEILESRRNQRLSRLSRFSSSSKPYSSRISRLAHNSTLVFAFFGGRLPRWKSIGPCGWSWRPASRFFCQGWRGSVKPAENNKNIHTHNATYRLYTSYMIIVYVIYYIYIYCNYIIL